MSAEDIVTLIASIIAFITSIITLIISIWHQNLYDKKHRRVVPAVSLLDTQDNIFDRMINDSNARIYVDIINNLEIIKKVNLCVCLKILNDFKINNCVVTVFIDDKYFVEKSVGTITDKRPVFIPTFLQNEKFKKLYCRIDYWTEAEEHLLYEINTGFNFGNRQDEVFLLRKHISRRKRLNILNSQLNLCYNPQEIMERLEENI